MKVNPAVSGWLILLLKYSQILHCSNLTKWNLLLPVIRANRQIGHTLIWFSGIDGFWTGSEAVISIQMVKSEVFFIWDDWADYLSSRWPLTFIWQLMWGDLTFCWPPAVSQSWQRKVTGFFRCLLKPTFPFWGHRKGTWMMAGLPLDGSAGHRRSLCEHLWVPCSKVPRQSSGPLSHRFASNRVLSSLSQSTLNCPILSQLFSVCAVLIVVGMGSWR